MTDYLSQLQALSEQQRARLIQLIQAQAITGQKKELVAYLVGADTTMPPTAEDLRQFLQNKLPDYMIPSRFVSLDAMPLTPNGKLDRAALPDPDDCEADDWDFFDNEFVLPRTETETTLAEIWQTVLGLDSISVTDNFFEIGGDSILSIQIIAKAKQLGLQLAPNQIFESPTIAELALSAESASDETTPQTKPSSSAGNIPLTPIQHWFFEQNLTHPAHWNQALFLEIPGNTDASILEKAFQTLIHHHDALRLQFRPTNTGWRQTVAVTASVILEIFDLTAYKTDEQSAAMEQHITQLQANFDLSQAPLLKLCLFDWGTAKNKQLLISAHHLVIDGVSWQILLNDLEIAYQQLAAGEPVTLSPQTTAYQHWAETLVQAAQTVESSPSLDYWLAQDHQSTLSIPGDFDADDLAIENDRTEGTAQTVSVSLSREFTQHLLYDASAAYNTQINDLLLTALAQSLWAWLGAGKVTIGLEGHGRESITSDLDLTRSIGWFTSFYPVFLETPAANDPGDIIKAIKEQLRVIPNNGIDYGIARYLGHNAQIRSQLAQHQPDILFNYLGQFDQMVGGTKAFSVMPEQVVGTRALDNQRRHLFEINTLVRDGQFRVSWTYDLKQYQRTTIEYLANTFISKLHSLIEHCLSPQAGGFTPSDFPEADLDQTELDDLLAEFAE